MTGRKRRHVIPLRLTEKELQHLNRLAEQSGLSREKFLRALIMGETIIKASTIKTKIFGPSSAQQQPCILP